MTKLNLAYFGTPEFSAQFLERLLTSNLPIDIKLVVTQPDGLIGRNRLLTPSPVKQIAAKHRLLTFDQNDLTDLSTHIKKHEIDLALVIAYGKILKQDVLTAPKITFADTSGFINVHYSLLPKYRGASPYEFALLLGDQTTGVSLPIMDEQLDHGPILTSQSVKIDPAITGTMLVSQLTDVAFELFSNLIPLLLTTHNQFIRRLVRRNLSEGGSLDESGLPTTPQSHSFATYTRTLKRDDGYLPLTILKKSLNNETLTPDELPAIIQWYSQKNQISLSSLIPNTQNLIPNMFRALSPWPGLWTLVTINGVKKRLKILDVDPSYSLKPKTENLIRSVQLEGKTEVSFPTFCAAYPTIFALP